ncbi:MAG: hypothetical protein ABIT05_16445 [Chitinophagaceae bacterium]
MKSLLLKLSGMWLFFLFTLQALAQTDKKVDVDINVGKDNSNWYQQPWVWIVGGAVFIIILVALLSGRGKKE